MLWIESVLTFLKFIQIFCLPCIFTPVDKFIKHIYIWINFALQNCNSKEVDNNRNCEHNSYYSLSLTRRFFKVFKLISWTIAWYIKSWNHLIKTFFAQCWLNFCEWRIFLNLLSKMYFPSKIPKEMRFCVLFLSTLWASKTFLIKIYGLWCHTF